MGREDCWSSRSASTVVQQPDTAAAPVIGSVVVLAAIGASTCLLVGSYLGEERMAARAHVAGACIALEMAQAQGALDAGQAARVRASLVTAVNPYHASFPITHEQFRGQCGALSAWGAMTAARRD